MVVYGQYGKCKYGLTPVGASQHELNPLPSQSSSIVAGIVHLYYNICSDCTHIITV